MLRLLILGLLLAASFQAPADTVHIQIEFSGGPPLGYTLTKSGPISSGVTALTALLNSLGGAAQSFDAPYTTSPSISENWIQWWRWGFGLSLSGMSLNGQTNGDWANNYWALYTRDSATSPFVSSWVGLADLAPADGSWIALKFISFAGGSPPEENVQFQSVSFTPPQNPDPPRLLSMQIIPPAVLELVFSTVPGATYRLETSSDLTAASWATWVSPFVATATATAFSLPVEPDEPRTFFRLALLQ